MSGVAMVTPVFTAQWRFKKTVDAASSHKIVFKIQPSMGAANNDNDNDNDNNKNDNTSANTNTNKHSDDNKINDNSNSNERRGRARAATSPMARKSVL